MSKYNLTKESYEKLLDDCYKKSSRQSDEDWSEIAAKHNLPWNSDSLRKASTSILGGSFVKQFYEEKYSNSSTTLDEDEYFKKLRAEKDEIRKERIKLQTLNVERNRIDRHLYRQELFYEQVGAICEALPLPDFKPILNLDSSENELSWLCCLSDLHYGASFKSCNNEYSPIIFKQRLETLYLELCKFILKEKITVINIACLGDAIQGILRISDLKLNDTSIVKSTVEVSRYISQFLNKLSEFVYVKYYHVPASNHTQIRPIGTKANELSDEDLEFVITNYIKDLCKENDRIEVILSNNECKYLEIKIHDFNIVAMHGHQIKNLDSSLRDLSMQTHKFVDYLILGHFHGGKLLSSYEKEFNDCEVIVCPSFVGSDPYSDSIMKGAKASVEIYGFDSIHGFTDKKKIILN